MHSWRGTDYLQIDCDFGTLPTVGGQITLPVSNVAQKMDACTVALRPYDAGSDSESASSGTAQFTFGTSHVTGIVTTDKPKLSVSIDGQMTVGCTLYLPLNEAGATDADAGPFFILIDSNLENDRCKVLLPLAGK
jgi:hypothetical protein